MKAHIRFTPNKWAFLFEVHGGINAEWCTNDLLPVKGEETRIQFLCWEVCLTMETEPFSI